MACKADARAPPLLNIIRACARFRNFYVALSASSMGTRSTPPRLYGELAGTIISSAPRHIHAYGHYGSAVPGWDRPHQAGDRRSRSARRRGGVQHRHAAQDGCGIPFVKTVLQSFRAYSQSCGRRLWLIRHSGGAGQNARVYSQKGFRLRQRPQPR